MELCVSAGYRNKTPSKQPWKCSCMLLNGTIRVDWFILIM